jgi:hypothetical protein
MMTTTDRSAASLYILARMAPVSLPDRRRYQTDIWVPAAATMQQVVAALVEAAIDTLRSDEEAKAVCVFAHADESPLGQGFNRGRAWMSRDGQGWRGDGRIGPDDEEDNGLIHVTIGEAGYAGTEFRLDPSSFD